MFVGRLTAAEEVEPQGPQGQEEAQADEYESGFHEEFLSRGRPVGRTTPVSHHYNHRLRSLGSPAKLGAGKPEPEALVAGDPVKTLREAVRRMTWTVEPGAFALIGFRGPPEAGDLDCLSHPPAQLVREPVETTLLVRDDRAEAVIARHADARCERDLAWIRELARAGIPIGAVCGFSRDHLFVARARLAATRAVLDRVFPQGPPSPRSG